MYSLADLNDIFFKIDTSFEISPLFDLVASAEGFTQDKFLKTFYPQDFLKKVGKKSKAEEPEFGDQGVYFDKARRSKLFNGALPYSRKSSLRCEIIFSITLEEWGYIHNHCKELCEKCSEGAAQKLENFLKEVLEEHEEYLPKTLDASYTKNQASLDVKLAVVMFLYLFLPLEVTTEEMQDDNMLALGKEITESLADICLEKPQYEIRCYEDGYEYMEFGHYPQTVVQDPKVLEKLEALENQEYEKMKTIPPAEMADYLKARGKEANIDGIEVEDHRYVSKTMYVNSFLDEIPENFVFSDNTGVEAKAYYCRVEPIKWRVLEKKETEEGTELFLISERILFKAAYNEHIRKEHGYVCQSGKGYAYSWEESDLRDKLNSDFDDSFINMAFTEEEKEAILTSVNDQSASWYFQSGLAEDKIFVLSEQEASRYLFSQTEEEYDVAAFRREHGYEYPRTALSAVGFLTDYALLSGVRPQDLAAYGTYLRCPHYPGLAIGGEEQYGLLKQGRLAEGETARTGAYWLRSPGDKNAKIIDVDKELDYTRRVANISHGGFINTRGVCVDGGMWEHGRNEVAKDGREIGVRPAMRILLKDDVKVVDKTENPWKCTGSKLDANTDVDMGWMHE